ncbi:hypothetical protein Bca4012_058238 [Brassica carinata]|uniref:Uncharacterized protein n=1 Tax=Brassica carinata TaxID=52824 RepID=A0A8X7W319_BRACI|nr:hypothetical protein Bca52824_015989 [Brassica carinata]
MCSSSFSSSNLSNEAFLSNGGLFLEPPPGLYSFLLRLHLLETGLLSASEPVLHCTGYWRKQTDKDLLFLSVSLWKDESEREFAAREIENEQFPVD